MVLKQYADALLVYIYTVVELQIPHVYFAFAKCRYTNNLLTFAKIQFNYHNLA